MDRQLSRISISSYTGDHGAHQYACLSRSIALRVLTRLPALFGAGAGAIVVVLPKGLPLFLAEPGVEASPKLGLNLRACDMAKYASPQSKNIPTTPPSDSSRIAIQIWGNWSVNWVAGSFCTGASSRDEVAGEMRATIQLTI
jgi:hypothetical protein